MHCVKCKTTKANKYVILRTNILKDGSKSISYYCNPCNTDRLKKYRKTANGKRAALKAVKKYELLNKERRNAWRAAYYRNRTLKSCTICGQTTNIHRHHPDIEQPTVIVFLCPAHHKQAHLTSK